MTLLRDLGFSPPDSSATITPNEVSTNAQCIELDLGTEAYQTISAFARKHGSSLFGVIYTAIALSLHKQSGLEDIVIGTSASGRTDAEFFDTVGYFTTMVAHRIQFDTEQSVESLLLPLPSMTLCAMQTSRLILSKNHWGCPLPMAYSLMSIYTFK